MSYFGGAGAVAEVGPTSILDRFYIRFILTNGFKIFGVPAAKIGGVVVCLGDYMDVTNSAFGTTLKNVKNYSCFWF